MKKIQEGRMIKGFRWKQAPNLVFTLLATLILILGDTLFSLFVNSYDLQPQVKNLVAASITFYLISLLKYEKSKLVLLALISIFMFIEMAHLSYYGTMFEPLEVWLFFNDFQEVMNVFVPDILVFIPALCMATLTFFLFLLLVKKTHVHSHNHKVAAILLLAVYIFPPVASGLHGSKFWKGATMDTFTFNATYRALGDFIVRILPQKVYGDSVLLSQNITDVKKGGEKEKGHIILIIGESLNLENMQLYGYARATTPYLVSLKSDKNFFYRKAVSCGVFTSTSLSFLLNATCHEDAYSELVLRQKCLFNLAKKQGYQTAFISGQTFSQQKTIVNFICPNAIDIRYNKPEGAQNFYDQDILPELEYLDWSKPQFIVIQMRGSHAPYDTYPENQGIYHLETEGNRHDMVRDHYDNTVVYSDKFFKQAFENIARLTDEPVHILMTSDHGESLGDDAKFGHGFISKPVISVPLFSYLIHPRKEARNPFSQQEYVSHIEATQEVLRLMGYTYSPKYISKKLFIMGPDIEGGSGYGFFDSQDLQLEKLE